MHKRIAVVALTLSLAGCATADFEQGLGHVLGAMGQSGSQTPLAEGEIIGGLREALAVGTTKAINQLGRTDGYWANAGVRIPLPPEMVKLEKSLRQFGQDKLVDDFHLTLNRAAEQAVPQVADIFGNAVRQMSIQDARAILNGSPDAATQFFRRTTSQSIYAKVYPIVQTSTQRVGVTQQYKKLASSYGPLLKMAGVKNLDLDSYVTEQALAGLFTTIAQEEARIRQNPAARTSEILKRVFGSQGR